MFKKPVFTLRQLKHMLHYNPKTGLWHWVNLHNGVKAGGRAGTNSHGYIRINIASSQYAAHRLAWFYMTGKWPQKRIDHRDNNPTNNKWKNLRFCTHSQNIAHSKLRSDNTHGLKGVHKTPYGRFQAVICHKKKSRHLGVYKTAELAHVAYMKAARELFGTFARAA